MIGRTYRQPEVVFISLPQVASDADIKGVISRVTGKEAKDVTSIASTFKALCSLADFENGMEVEEQHNDVDTNNTLKELENKTGEINLNGMKTSSIIPDFHYNIQIHLPATTDISVYNAIFKSIKDNLL